MKFAYFTHWILQKNKVKADPKQSGNYSPEGMLPILLDADVFNFAFPLFENDLDEYNWVILNNDKHFYDNKALVEIFFNIFTKENHPKLCILQEGPIFDWQTWTMERQWTYRKLMNLADLFLCNNEAHVEYYKEYCKNVAIFKVPLILNDFIQRKVVQKGKFIVINGNLTPWYNGNSSLDIANSQQDYRVIMPTMGQRQEQEVEYLPLLLQNKKFVRIPFVSWNNWMDVISQCEFGINMMTAIACGTFSVACAASGVLCIGNEGFDTQKYLFPNLSVKSHEIKKGKELLKKLIEDPEFRMEQEKIMNERIKEYDVEVIKKDLLVVFERLNNDK